MYSRNFVLSILVNNSVRQEHVNGEVEVPFGCEYAIRLRNRNNRRASATVSVDGETIGTFVVDAHSSIDIEQPPTLTGKFRFVSIQSNAAASESKDFESKSHGLITVEWKLEKQQESIPIYKGFYNPPVQHVNQGVSRSLSREGGGTAPEWKNSAEQPTSAPLGFTDKPQGCTVSGSSSSQRFHTVSFIPEPGEGVIMRLYLRGYGEMDAEPITHNMKYCDNCGAKQSRAKASFCWKCGHKLTGVGINE